MRICGGSVREAIHDFISFRLGVSPLSPLTLREASISDLSSIAEAISGSFRAERSHFPAYIHLWAPLGGVILLLSSRAGSRAGSDRDQAGKVELHVPLLSCRLRGGLKAGRPVLVRLVFGLDCLCLRQEAVGGG
ncbi:unnamed protein product [Sphagnum troendelagicum]|uniref:Uncharacterized protein n=1 Tax=Sphagnum troendelagicum TaxID=128251 RepID=A0ABP0UHU3_9BRYO